MKKINLLIFSIGLALLTHHLYSNGVWSYLDTDLFLRLLISPEDIRNLLLYSFGNSSSYFGYDLSNYNSTLFSHLLIYYHLSNIIGVESMQIIIYTVVIILNFYISFKLASAISNYLKYKNDKEVNYLVALVCTFNPFSVWLMWNGGYIFILTGFLLLFYSNFKLFIENKNNIIYYLCILLSFTFIISYPRIGYIMILFNVVFFLHILKFSKINIKKLISITSIIIIFPIVYINFFDNISSGENLLYLFNKQFDNWYKILYDISLNGKDLSSFTIFPPDQLKMLYKGSSIVDKGVGFIFIVIFILSLILNRKKEKIYYFFVFTTFFIFFIQNIIPLLSLSFEFFEVLASSKLNFLFADPTTYRFLLIIPLVYFLITIYFNVKKKILIYLITYIFILLSMSPIFFKENDQKLKSVTEKDIVSKFYDLNKGEKKSTLFFPNETYLLFNGLNYPIKQVYFSSSKNIFNNNPRAVSVKQTEIHKKMNKYIDLGLKNLYVFNGKNIVILNNINYNSNISFDFYKNHNFKNSINIYNQNILNNKDYNLLHKTEYYSEYITKNSNNFEYFIYSPAKIEKENIDTFFNKELNIDEKIINIDPEYFNSSKKVNNFSIRESNKDINIDYKKSKLNPTKYYLKLSNFDKTNPFLVQLNQTFGMSWKLKWITKDEYDSKKCLDEFVKYSITDNSVCNYKHTYINTLNDYKYLTKKEVKAENHFEGNFVGNTWLVEKDDLPDNVGEELYAIIIYEKQIYYTWTLIISGLTFLVLLLLAIIQETRIFLNKKKIEA